MSQTGQIKQFFANQTIFLTGGSGFLGKVLIEKILRECQDLKKMYLLMRPKKGKTPEERFQDLFNFECFDGLKSKNPDVFQKVALISGDCQEPFLGLTAQDSKILIEETTCVIHAAANVKFDQSLREAADNVRATRDLLELAKKMKKLKVFVHVSTLYSNCIYSHIKEEFYEPPMAPKNFLNLVEWIDDKLLEVITPHVLGDFPNCYIFGKNLNEDLIRSYQDDLPITMVRPSNISSSDNEPMPGWIDNFYGSIGIMVGAGLGLIKSVNVDPDICTYSVPVDYVSNCILAASWKRSHTNETTIYNFVVDKKYGLTYGELESISRKDYWNFVLNKTVMYNNCKLIKNPHLHKIQIFFLHTLFSYIADFVLFCLGKPTRAVRIYKRLNKLLTLSAYFSTRKWHFENENVAKLCEDLDDEDKLNFIFDMSRIDFPSYIKKAMRGAKLYLFKESLDTVPKLQRRLIFLTVIHYLFVITFYWFIVRILFAFLIFMLR